MNNSLKLTALTLGMAFAASSMAADLTVVSFGGANKNAQVKAFYSPWEAAGHGKVIAGEYNGEMAKVKAMVDTQSVSWHLVEVESPELALGLNTQGGFVTYKAVADDLDLAYRPIADAIA